MNEDNIVARELNMLRVALTLDEFSTPAHGVYTKRMKRGVVYTVRTGYMRGEGSVALWAKSLNVAPKRVGYYRGPDIYTWALKELPKVFGQSLRVRLTDQLPTRNVVPVSE